MKTSLTNSSTPPNPTPQTQHTNTQMLNKLSHTRKPFKHTPTVGTYKCALVSITCIATHRSLLSSTLLIVYQEPWSYFLFPLPLTGVQSQSESISKGCWWSKCGHRVGTITRRMIHVCQGLFFILKIEHLAATSHHFHINSRPCHIEQNRSWASFVATRSPKRMNARSECYH